jgi:hypothetical protein
MIEHEQMATGMAMSSNPDDETFEVHAAISSPVAWVPFAGRSGRLCSTDESEVGELSILASHCGSQALQTSLSTWTLAPLSTQSAPYVHTIRPV